MKPTVLIVDDDAAIRYTLREILENNDVEVHECDGGAAARAWLERRRADLVITDLRMPGGDGMELLEALRAMPDAPRAVMITAHGSEREAVAAMKLGAFDYFSKPFDVDEIMGVVERAVSSIRALRENEQLRAELHLARHLVFASEAMRKVALLLYRVAPRDVTVLLSGASGTGKERIAEAIVAGSPRAGKRFARFNCAALPRELAEAELFGHARGAFTGAHRARPGLFREASGGTVFLDEIGELDLATQGKLLRVLQERVVRPLGEDRDVPVDVRILAATNRDLAREAAAGRFRQDLLYRLRVVELRVPPLAERTEDVPLLIDHFLRRFGERFAVGDPVLGDALRARLVASPYPGNVRELEHTIERLVALSRGGVIDEGLEDISESPAPVGLREQLEAFERELIARELDGAAGNRSETARRLRIGRVTLLEKMKKYGLT
jgi:two-component system response regulator HydG